MARLRTIGFEAKGVASSETTGFEGVLASPAALETTIVRSGLNSVKCDSGGANQAAFVQLGLSAAESVLGRSYYTRWYVYVASYPGSTIGIAKIVNGSSDGFAIQMTSTGALRLVSLIAATPTQIGSDSVPVNQNQWLRLELFSLIATGATDAAELRMDGVSLASGSGLNVSDTPPTIVSSGWNPAPGANKILYLDDIAINDDQGSSQNSWPGEGKIVVLKPISDNAVGTGWVDGDGAGTLFGSVDNIPPVGVGTAADGTQIKNLTSTTTGNYDANCTTYANAGIVAGDLITVVQAVCDHSEDVNTSTKNGALQIVSNPTQSGEDSFTYGDDAGSNGTWPTNWRAKWGTAQYLPAVTLTTSAVVRVGKRTATTRQVDVDFMGIMVEFVQGIFPPWHQQARVATNTLIRM